MLRTAQPNPSSTHFGDPREAHLGTQAMGQDNLVSQGSGWTLQVAQGPPRGSWSLRTQGLATALPTCPASPRTPLSVSRQTVPPCCPACQALPTAPQTLKVPRV